MIAHHDESIDLDPRRLTELIQDRLAHLPERAPEILSGLLGDPETGLLESHYFRRRLEEEFARAGKAGTSLGLVIIRLDAERPDDEPGGAEERLARQEAAGALLLETRDFDLVTHLEDGLFAVALTFAIRSLKTPVRMGQDALKGRNGVVKTEIPRHGNGQVQLASELWSAELAEPGDPLPPGTRIEVVDVQGLRLRVRAIDKD